MGTNQELVRVLATRLESGETIEALVADGTTVLPATQNLEASDRIVVIDHGKVVAEGTVDELRGRVGGQRLEVTLTHESAAFAAMIALEGMSETPVHADGILVWLQVPEREGAIMEAARRLSRAGVGASDLVVRRPTLDEVVLSLAGSEAPELEQIAAPH